MHLWAAGLLCLATTGCALPLPSRGDGTRSELLLGYAEDVQRGDSDYVLRARRIVIGLDLRAGRDLGGANLGWSDIRVLNPTPEGEATESKKRGGPRYAMPLGVEWIGKKGNRCRTGLILNDLPGLDDFTHFTHFFQMGIGSRVSELSKGGYLGVGSVTSITAPPGDSAIYALDYDSRNFGKSTFTKIKEGTEK